MKDAAARKRKRGSYGMPISKRRKTLSPAASLAQATRQALTRLQPEVKNVDTTIGSTSTAAASVTLLNGVAQGTTISTRLGNRIQMKSAHIDMLAQSQNDNDVHTMLRAWIVYDSQPNGSAATLADIYTLNGLCAVRNMAQVKRYRVLFDSGILNFPTAHDGVTPLGTERAYHLNQMRKFSLGVEYKSAAANIADISTGSLYLFVTPSGGSANTVWQATVRVKYTDV